jgi:hypothetical protein
MFSNTLAVGSTASFQVGPAGSKADGLTDSYDRRRHLPPTHTVSGFTVEEAPHGAFIQVELSCKLTLLRIYI